MVFLDSSVNLGELTTNYNFIEVDFKYVNKDRNSLSISNIESGCFCNRVHEVSEIVMPGDTGLIRVHYYPKRVNGPFSEEIIVNFNEIDRDFKIKFFGTRNVEINADQIFPRRFAKLGLNMTYIALGSIPQSGSVTDTIRIFNFDEDPMDLKLVDGPTNIEIGVYPATLMPNQEGIIVYTYTAADTTIWGEHFNSVLLQIDSEEPWGNVLTFSAFITDDFSKVKEKYPKINVKNDHLDFGVINEGETYLATFEFTNSGNDVLIIRNVRATCGCTVVMMPVKVYNPGQKGEIQVEFRSKGYPGKQIKMLELVTNDKDNAIVTLTLSGIVEVVN